MMTDWTQLAEKRVERTFSDPDPDEPRHHHVTATIERKRENPKPYDEFTQLGVGRYELRQAGIAPEKYRVTILGESGVMQDDVLKVDHTVKVVAIENHIHDAVSLANSRFKTAEGNQGLMIQALSQAHAEAVDILDAENEAASEEVTEGEGQ